MAARPARALQLSLAGAIALSGLTACDATPTDLGDFDPRAIDGDWGIIFSAGTSALEALPKGGASAMCPGREIQVGIIRLTGISRVDSIAGDGSSDPFTLRRSTVTALREDIHVSTLMGPIGTTRSTGGALPDTIIFAGVWQQLGHSSVGTLTGWFERDTGVVFMRIGRTHLRGIFLDSDHAALTYENATTGCSGRASGLRVK